MGRSCTHACMMVVVLAGCVFYCYCCYCYFVIVVIAGHRDLPLVLANCLAKCARVLENRILGRQNHSDRHGAPDVLILGVSMLARSLVVGVSRACPNVRKYLHQICVVCSPDHQALEINNTLFELPNGYVEELHTISGDSSQPVDGYTHQENGVCKCLCGCIYAQICLHACVDVCISSMPLYVCGVCMHMYAYVRVWMYICTDTPSATSFPSSHTSAGEKGTRCFPSQPSFPTVLLFSTVLLFPTLNPAFDLPLCLCARAS